MRPKQCETVKTSEQVYKVKGIVQKQEIKSKFKRYYKAAIPLAYSSKLIWSWLNLVLQFSCPTSLLSLFLLEDLNKLEHIGVSFPCDSLQLFVPPLEVVVGPGAAHWESSPQCFKLTFTSFYFFSVPPLLL